MSGSIPLQVALEKLQEALPVQPKVIEDKGIGPELVPKEKEQEEQYEYVLEEKDKSDQASALSLQMERVIR